VLRSAFLDAPGLDRCAGENNLEVMIDESTIREEYSDLTLIKGERMMAGAYIAYTLTLNEVTGVPTLSDTSMYDVEAYNIGAQEDFEDL
jgi:hypothetical protein